MKTQPKCSTLSPYQRISLSMGTAALACVLGTTLAPLQPIYPAPASASSKAPAAPAPAATAPAPALPEVKPNKEGIYDFTKDTDVKNPFPDVITPAEVKELQDKTTSGYPFSYTIKSFYTPAGKEFKVVNGKPEGDTQEFTYQIQNTYENMLGRIDNYIFIPRAKEAYDGEGEIRPYRSSREFRNDDGSLSLDDSKATDTVIPYTLEINGKFIGKDLTTKTPFEYYMNRNQTFVHMTMHGRKADEIIYGVQSLNYMGSSAAPGLFAFIPECGAQFHFVDDLQYRDVAHIKDTGELSQRSAGETDKFSTKPYTKYNLSDLADIKSIRDVKFINNAIGNYFVPLLSYDGDKKKDSVKRPTMKELTSTNIPGYLYYSNDIDTPEGGTFTKDNTEKFGNYDYGIVRDKNDNQVTTKHYYVTYRPIPTQLVVQYKNNDGSYKDASYSLLNANNSQVTGGFKASIADIAVPQKPALETMIKSKDTVLLGAGAGYVSEGLAYLAPGSYTVAPLADAPEGYEWVVASTQVAGTTGSAPTQAAAREAHITAPVHKDDTSALQQVVTFVLRKKIAPPPQPGPYPLPEPVPVPVPEVPAPAPTPEPELIVPAIEAPTPTVPAEAPAPIVRKRPRALPQTSDPMAISAVGELGMIFGVAAGSLAATLRRKRRNR